MTAAEKRRQEKEKLWADHPWTAMWAAFRPPVSSNRVGRRETQRTTKAGSLVTTAASLSLPDPHPLPSSSADLRVLCGKKLRCLEEKALRLLHWGLTSEKRSERRLARQIMRQWLRVDDAGEVVWWKKPPKKRRRDRKSVV